MTTEVGVLLSGVMKLESVTGVIGEWIIGIMDYGIMEYWKDGIMGCTEWISGGIHLPKFLHGV